MEKVTVQGGVPGLLSAVFGRLWSVFLLITVHCSLITSTLAQVPGIINYQGRVVVNGTNFTGTGQFKFALVDDSGATTFWSNDGTSTGEPATAVSITVSKGLYAVLLGQSPMVPISAIVFTNADIRLRVWFDGGNGMQQLSPDQRIAAVGYAMVAASVDSAGLTGTIPDVRLSPNVVVRGGAGAIYWGSGGSLHADQGGSLELGNSALTGAVPFIDFHYGVAGGSGLQRQTHKRRQQPPELPGRPRSDVFSRRRVGRRHRRKCGDRHG